MLTLMLFPSRTVHAAEPPPLNPRVTIAYGDAVTILLPLDGIGPVARVEVYLRAEGAVETYTSDMTLENGLARYTHPVREKPLPLFGQVFYWFKVHPVTGEVYESPAFVFRYADNRFPWQARTVAPVEVYWYSGGADVAESALNAAHIALQNAYTQWQGHLAPEQTVQVYLYATPQDLASALEPYPPEQRAHAVGARVVLAYGGMSPQARAAMQRDIVHQVVRIVLQDTLGDAYANLPWWLREGLAVLAEPQASAADYSALTEAATTGQLIPLVELCRTPDPEAAPEDRLLAQSEAGAFVAHLFARYGPAGLRRLLEVYGSGLGCEEGFRAALGVSLADLEHDWRSAQGLYPQERLSLGWVAAWVALGMVVPLTGLVAWHWRSHGLPDPQEV